MSFSLLLLKWHCIWSDANSFVVRGILFFLLTVILILTWHVFRITQVIYIVSLLLSKTRTFYRNGQTFLVTLDVN